jgi:ribonuclease P protein component
VARAFEEAMREEDVPTEQSPAEQEARLPFADADESRSRRAPASAGQEPRPPVGLIWPIRERSMFRALARGRRRRRGDVMVSCAVVAPMTEPPRVAYAVGRPVGGAVVRNRVRRRLRAATRVHAAALSPGHAYLVHARPGAAGCSYRDLEAALEGALCALQEETR